VITEGGKVISLGYNHFRTHFYGNVAFPKAEGVASRNQCMSYFSLAETAGSTAVVAITATTKAKRRA
jgi:hypothetical protein